MTEKQLGMIRHTLSTIGGYMVASGIVQAALMDMLIGVAMVVIPFVWSWKSKKVEG